MSSSASTSAVLGKVRAALRSEPRLAEGFRLERADIDRDGAVVLEGEVASVAAKKRALERVAALEPVSAVVDRLRVTPASPMSDAEIRSHLRQALVQEPAFRSLELRELHHDSYERGYEPVYEAVAGAPQGALGRIDVEVRDGIVTLNGRVPGLASKRLAGVLAWWVAGARDVVNGLAVEPPEEDGPDRIAEAVRMALEKDPFVDASQVKVGVRGRVVHLTGLVPTVSERDMAERDAWYVFGVDDVINDIEASA